MKLEPDERTIETREIYTLKRDDIEELVRIGLNYQLFFDGQPGSGQTLALDFDFGCCTPRCVAVLKTRS